MSELLSSSSQVGVAKSDVDPAAFQVAIASAKKSLIRALGKQQVLHVRVVLASTAKQTTQSEGLVRAALWELIRAHKIELTEDYRLRLPPPA
jgi:hypothetical protein